MTNELFKPNSYVFGGTEYMVSLFKKHIEPELPILKSYNCILLPGYLPSIQELILDEREIILWIHNPLNQFEPQLLLDLTHPKISEKIKAVIVVSNYLKSIIVNELNINKNKVFVIYNVIEPILNNIERFKQVDTPKIIYTSSADRGLDILLESIPKIKENIEVNIFSNYYPDIDSMDINYDSRINFYGLTPRKTVRKALSESHIFAYPCTFNETFCISLGDAISANCLPVHTDQAALVEIGLRKGMVYEFPKNNHVDKFSEILEEAILRIKSNCYDPKDNANNINERYSLQKFKTNWFEFTQQHLYLFE